MNNQTNTGFVAGTLVHTDKGLVPIQDIKVGDRVLSKPEDGSVNNGVDSDIEYKSVLNTFKSSDKQKVYKLEYTNETATEQRAEQFLHYILCTDNHLFWALPKSASFNNGGLLPTEQLSSCFLYAVNGDKTYTTKRAITPVRTLPNFPTAEDAEYAYAHNLFHYKTSRDSSLKGIEFIEFSDSKYNYLTMADKADRQTQRAFSEDFGTLIKAPLNLNEREPLKVDYELFATLLFRMIQDDMVIFHTKEAFRTYIENNGGMTERLERSMSNLEKYGDNTGLQKKSIHLSMKGYNGDNPNPYKARVYNIEVADYHTYFVGHDGIWVMDRAEA